MEEMEISGLINILEVSFKRDHSTIIINLKVI